MLLLSNGAHAIKIVVPDQYQDQIKAIKEAERKLREQELQGDVKAAEGEGISIAEAAKPASKPQVDADEFLVQSVVEATATAATFEGTLEADQGIISGQVVDKETGAPISGAAIILEGTDIATVTAEDGRYSLGPAPAGDYTLSFIKSGYIEANVTDYTVAGGEVSVFPFAMPPRPAEMSDDVYELQDFTVTAEEANDLMMKLDIRMNSDKMLDIMGSEDFSKFAAGDVGDAVKRIVGVSVIEGQFAIIRGLEDRYSSTLFNGASIPSPDPNRQSVQLDLFSTDVVSNLQVAKSFSSDQPGNSAGGTIDVITAAYPEEENSFEGKLSVGTGFNSNSMDRFIHVNHGKAVGSPDSAPPLESDASVKFSGRKDFKDREFRFIVSYSNEIDYDTQVGKYEESFASRQTSRVVGRPPRIWEITPGSLSFGEMPGKSPLGSAEYTKSKYSELTSAFLGFGADIDKEGKHKIDAVIFRSQAEESTAELRENYETPGGSNPFNPSTDEVADALEGILDRATADALRFQSRSVERERQLDILQLRGDHTFDSLDELKVKWNLTKTETNQTDSGRSLSYWYEPFDVTSVGSGSTAPSSYHASFSQNSSNPLRETSNTVDETSTFARVDLEYTFEPLEVMEVTLGAGVSSESAERDVESSALTNLSGSFSAPTTWDQSVGSAQAVEDLLLNSDSYRGASRVSALTLATREIDARHFQGKVSFWDKFDLLGGIRNEKIDINVVNEPYTFLTQADIDAGASYVTLPDGRRVEAEGFRGASSVPAINPTVLFMFERAGPGPEDGFPTGTDGINNPAILGNENAPNNITTLEQLTSVLNGSIQEDLWLPNVGFAYRPIEGMRFSFNYSETVARPSFRELGYYLSAPDASDDLVIGNPQLDISEVDSLDFRFEYAFGGRGDVVAISLFKKSIANPIESIRLTDPLPNTQYQTFFNNPNTADMVGIEFEFRKTLDFTPWEFMEMFSIGGNATYIDASIDRSTAYISQYDTYFADDSNPPRQNLTVDFTQNPELESLPASRRLFNQPEWILNADVSFNNPDWGTSATLAYFAISDVLESVGSVSVDRTGLATGATPDRYIDSFGQLDLIVTQQYKNWTFKFTVKNLTDSTRRLIYDPYLVDSDVPAEREYKVGRDYSISASYAF